MLLFDNNAPIRQKHWINTKVEFEWSKELQKYVDAVGISYSVNDAFLISQRGGSFSALTIVQLFARLYKIAVLMSVWVPIADKASGSFHLNLGRIVRG